MSSGPRILHTHRQTVHIIERAKVYVQDGRILSQIAESGSLKSFNVPYANISVLLLGSGTSLTTEAARLLCKEGVYVAFTGSGGTPLHYGSLMNYQVTEHLHRMISVAASGELSLDAANIIMQRRADAMSTLPSKIGHGPIAKFRKPDALKICKPFLNKCSAAKSAQEIMGYEGNFAKAIYSNFSRLARLDKFKRSPGDGKSDSREDEVNSRIDQGNDLAYGVAGAVLWSLGIPPALSVLHGKTRAGGLVFDLADSFKDALILPLAFSEFETEQEFRSKVISAIQDHDIMKKCFDTMTQILSLSERQVA